MQSEVPQPANSETIKGLPPVAPPSGRHILQLFLVPGIIVGLLVVGWLIWNKFTRSWYTPESFLERLDNSNPKIRWRAADDLAQVVLRDDQLASNPHFGLDLAERLHQALETSAANEKSFNDRLPKLSPTEQGNERKTLDAERVYIEYLSACLGNFMIPVGVPVLIQEAGQEDGADGVTIARRRRRAISALATLGPNLKRFDQLPPDQRQAVSAGLQQEIGPSDRGHWAEAAYQHLQARQENRPESMGVEAALVSCGSATDPFLREMAAVACNYWIGTPEENSRLEAMLARLLNDQGQGATEAALAPLFHDEEGHGVDDDPLRWSLVIHAQAVVALARRDSPKFTVALLLPLLDEPKQLQDFHHQTKEGQVVGDEALAYATVSNALKSVADLHRKNPGRDLSSLVPPIEQLTHSTNVPVRTEAERALLVLRGA